MADNITLPGTGANVATDDVAGVQFQRVKLDLGADGASAPVSGALPVSGPLTDAELRAAAVPVSVAATVAVSGPVTDAQLRATAVPVSLAATVPVSGPVTDAQLRATAVPVSGPLTDTQLRASAVPISAAALPLPSGAATETTLAAMNAKLPAAGQTTMAGSQPVTIASNQTALPIFENALILTGQTAQTATVNNILENPSSATATTVDNYRSMSVQVISSGTGGTFIFEQSNDNTNWVPLPAYNNGLTNGVPIVAAITATASAIVYSVPLRCRFVRLRIASTITGGSIAAVSRLSADPWTPSIFTVAQTDATRLSVTTAGTVTATLAAGTARAEFVAAAGIWYDDSSTNLGSSATFTGTSRDATLTATATAMANAATYAQEVRACAESDVTGTLWLEVSRDNTNWRRIRSVATAAITGGGFAAELIYRPSWRYWRIGYTNGAGAQARFALGTVAMAN